MADRSANREKAPRPAVDVAAWRRARLIRAGLGEHAAAKLSLEPALDLHVLLELVDRGCPPDLAARIVAPLDSQGDSSEAGRRATGRKFGVPLVAKPA